MYYTTIFFLPNSPTCYFVKISEKPFSLSYTELFQITENSVQFVNFAGFNITKKLWKCTNLFF